jgi:hypothetical protein
MSRANIYFHCLLFVLMLSGCALKKGLQEAQNMEDSGLHEMAYERYVSLWKEYQAWEAKAGMNKSAESILTQKFNPLQSACDRSDSYQNALSQYDAFVSFSAKYAEQHPDLVKTFQSNVVPFKNQCKAQWIGIYEAQMRQFGKTEQWTKANQVAESLLAMDANHQEAKLMQRLAQVEMAVALAEQAMQEGFYRQAHQYASAALLWDKNESRAEKIREECLDRCAFSMRVVLMAEQRMKDRLVQKLQDFGVQSRVLGRDQFSDLKFLSAYLESYLTQGEFPFVQVLNDNHFESISKEQLNALNLQYSQENADVVLGELKTASALLVIEPLVWEMKTSELEKIPHWVMQRKGREDKVIKVYLEPESVYLNAQLRLSLINTSTGTTLASEIMDLSGQRLFYTLDSDVSAAQLFPTEQGGENSIYLSREQLLQIQERQTKSDRYRDVLDMAIEKWRGKVIGFLAEIERGDFKR